ncbi:hypothetical protein Bcav_0101 [Beutenbergia cavernae DSM 12333]|uniref:SHOCT domain-containing protein n=1 Tax=Beutenbergia cavernae (strain ATCC BAA-8 / DSM 12333 / CCUG 43141 / JCM 11478 / NBRC 16432 / NCIMB 13614 / HKI 0122) TaxID=471853 RepID=C5BUZ2_BEUC1|nr:hypothetical protein [Beutenbergia cavernae]ACQ78366.1 hypothetical protein Bcav_0101 [Beutenbergia cavernae DSM 12333]
MSIEALPALADGATHWGGPFPFFWIFPLFWLVVIGLLIWAFARRRSRGHWGPPWAWGPPAAGSAAPSAEQVLADRFARGDINEQEYRARLGVLRSTGSTPPGVPPQQPPAPPAG